jgi:hypothetical protein
MRIIKKLLLLVLGLVGLVLIAGLLMKKEYSVVKEVTINQPKDSVFNYIKFLKNQDNFSVWSKMDPAMKKFSKGTDGQVGAINGWDSQQENVGAGEQEIKNIVNGERIDFELRFKRPMESTEQAYISTESVNPNQTKVKWGFNGKFPYPMNVMMPFMGIEEMIGNDLQKGLDNLKVELEK